MTERYLCIHGHFYQPPRENPWLDAVEYQASASPYHDWNERITRECYGPNARARLHGKDGRISDLINNYEFMSFDFGPTLLSWLENTQPWVYDQILAADRLSRDLFEGHGNALAQVYNHIIMPLANRRDKLTQIRWGLADFNQRFGRPPEGMWLAETAVDSETLNLLAEEGIKFTILSPTQAQSVRPLAGNGAGGAWMDVSGGRINTTRPYRIPLGSRNGHFIDVFFYDGPISRAVAYETLLASGEDLLARIEKAFGLRQDGPQLVSLATDGESYGHHFKFGDLALAWLFNHLEETGQIKVINYSLFLERFPPEEEVQIVENSSWSCAHGVERWRADCGCSVSQNPEWNQEWRTPLREGLEWLGDKLAEIYERRGGLLFRDPWEARDEYIEVFLDSTADGRGRFLDRHATRTLEHEEQVEAWQLLESQRMALFMFTSCGWFFDDIAGLEPVQVLKYAARAIELVESYAEYDLESKLLRFLSRARSNDPDYRDGKGVYETRVITARLDPSLAAANHGFESLVDGVPIGGGFFSEMVRPTAERRLTGENTDAVLRETKVVERGTGKIFMRIYLAIRLETGKRTCLVGEATEGFDLERMAGEVRSLLGEKTPDEIEEIFRLQLRGVKTYGLEDLMPDTRKVLMESLALHARHLMRDYIRRNEGFFAEIFSLIEKSPERASEIPEDVLRVLLFEQLEEFFLSDMQKDPSPPRKLHDLTARAKSLKIGLDEPGIRELCQEYLARQVVLLSSEPGASAIRSVIEFIKTAEDLDLKPDLWECQNIFYDLYTDPEFLHDPEPELSSIFHELGIALGFYLRKEE